MGGRILLWNRMYMIFLPSYNTVDKGLEMEGREEKVEAWMSSSNKAYQSANQHINK